MSPLESSRRGGHFEYRHAYTLATDVPSAMADAYSYGRRGSADVVLVLLCYELCVSACARACARLRTCARVAFICVCMCVFARHNYIGHNYIPHNYIGHNYI